MEALLKKLTNQDIKEQLFVLAVKELNAGEFILYGALLDTLELRLSEDDFSSFGNQLDKQVLKAQGRIEK